MIVVKIWHILFILIDVVELAGLCVCIYIYIPFSNIFVPMFSITIISLSSFLKGYSAKNQWICELLPQLERIQKWIWICWSWILDRLFYYVLNLQDQEIHVYTDCLYAFSKFFKYMHSGTFALNSNFILRQDIHVILIILMQYFLEKYIRYNLLLRYASKTANID